MSPLDEESCQFANANSVHLYGHMLRREDGHVLSMVLGLEVKRQKRNRRLSKHGKSWWRKGV